MEKTLELNGRKITLVGTAHVSLESIEEVKKSIEKNKPDCVAVELDENRLKSIENPDSWKEMDIIKVLKKKMGFLMLANLILAGYQKRMGENSGVKPGDELKAAVEKARELNLPLELVDRSITVTLRRAWAKNSFYGKMRLLTMLLATAFTNEEVTPEEIENLKTTSEMDTMMSDLAKFHPTVKEVLIDERDLYLASHIWQCKGDNVLAVLGAGHLNGVVKHLESFAQGSDSDCGTIGEVPKPGAASKVIGWLIPVIIIAMIAAGFVFGGMKKGSDLLGTWVIWNGALAGIGAIAGAAHPLTVLVSIIGAPLTSLCPLIGVGVVAGIVQAWIKKPKISDMENLASDATSVKGFYRNRILRVLIIFFLSSIGSSIGTFASTANIIEKLLKF